MFANNEYLDGEALLQILIDRFSKDDVKKGFILDGGMRTVPETEGFPKVLNGANLGYPLFAVNLKISETETFNRLLTGENSRKRKDDTYEGIKSRLEKHYHKLNERLEIIRNTPGWHLIEIDASPEVQIVYKSVVVELLTF